MNKFEKSSLVVLLITSLLAIVAFLPLSHVSLEIVKTAVITTGILLASLLYLIGAFKSKELMIPKHPLTYISCGIIVSIILSTFLSTSFIKSLFGQGFEIGTTSFLIILFISSLLTIYLTNKSKDRILYVYGSVIVSFIIITLFYVIRFIFGADVLTFDIFKTITLNMFGKWIDLGLLSGLLFLLSFIAIRFVKFNKFYRILLVILATLSGVFVLIVNSPLVWSILLISILAIGFYEYHVSPSSDNGIRNIFKRIPVLTTIIALILIVCIWKGEVMIKPVSDKLGIVQTEVVLPWQLTLDIASDTIKESPFFGAGPNRFVVQYLKFKPINDVNPTVFWNTEFVNGFGLIPSFIVTQGIVGIILWIALIVVFIRTGLKALRKENDVLSRFFVVSTFFPAIFLWLSTLVYTPSHSTLFLTFIFSGLFISVLINEGQILTKNIAGDESPILKKFFVIIYIALTLITFVWLIVFMKRTIAFGYFEGGISALNLSNNEGLSKAESNFKKAIMFNKSDTYFQALSEINILKINLLAQKIQNDSKNNGGSAKPEDIKIISNLLEEGLKYTNDAIKLDPTNYYNYIANARISEFALSLQAQGAYENVRTAYTSALKYNPYNPLIYLNFARVEVSQNKLEEAKRNIGIALQLKQNYVDAIFLLSQIQVNQGQTSEAITSLKITTQINPNNPLLFFQLGLLHYNNKNYTEAINALSEAIRLDNQYANARYFLGLSYARLNKIDDAIIQFENLATTNSENEEIRLILANLKQGKTPFADAKPPIDSKPEKRKTLPISGN